MGKKNIKELRRRRKLEINLKLNSGQQPQQQQPAIPTEPPEVRFRDQLAQLEEMGFSEKSRNIRALLASGGDVQAAIDYLFSMK